MIGFIHIPKTGGSAAFSAFKRAFGADAVVSASSREKMRALRRNPPGAGIELVGAHETYLRLRDILGADVRYCAVVREPLARIVSLYRHIARHPDHPEHAHAQTMEEWLDYVASGDLRSAQSRFLEGAPASVIIGDTASLDPFIRTVLRVAGRSHRPPDRINTAEGAPPAISRALRARIEQVYTADFEHYSKLSGLTRLLVS